MPVFAYKIIDENAERISGKINKASRAEAEEYLLKMYPNLIDLREYRGFFSFRAKLSKKELAGFCRGFYYFIESGLSLSATLLYLRGQNNIGGKIKKIMTELYESIMRGESLWLAMRRARFFPDLMIEMTKVGEQGGLALTFSRMAEFYEKESFADEELRNALIYPVIVAFMMIAVIALFIIYVVHSYAVVFASGDMPLPLPTRILLGVNKFAAEHLAAIFLGLIAAVSAVFAFSRGPVGRSCVDWLKLNAPIVRGVHRKRVNLHFSQAMHILLSSGMEVAPAIDAAAEVVGNVITRGALKNEARKVQQGAPLEHAADSVPGLEPFLGVMLSAGCETGSLARAMANCAARFYEELSLQTSRLNKMIEPVMIILLGGVLAFIMLAVILPTFSMVDLI
ncbi:MAG: type II secretion system F family protein [Clostridiales bacterium]|jgi:type IV pilus assembly protein PilC|nr:type II secretion system F family protein [Clostridiales bacterium]